MATDLLAEKYVEMLTGCSSLCVARFTQVFIAKFPWMLRMRSCEYGSVGGITRSLVLPRTEMT
jgi:hypothetical protein